MGLGLYYKENDVFIAMSEDDDVSVPLTTIHDGKLGDTKTVTVYLRNDDATKWFSNIKISPLDLIDAEPYGDIIYSETGWGVKLYPGSVEPTSGEWDDIDWGDQITMANVGASGAGDTATYYPFWYLITCPPNTDAKVKTDIVFNVGYTENAV